MEESTTSGGAILPGALKRQHDDAASNAPSVLVTLTSPKKNSPSEQQISSSIPHHFSRGPSPALSDTDSVLSDTNSHTPTLMPGSPQQQTAFSALDGMTQPPKKRVKLSFAEQEQRRILKEIRDRQKADERAKREVDKKEKEQDKARKDAEREAERKKREAEREEKRVIKEAEKAEKEKERKAKEDEKRKKEEEKQKIEEEKKKKERGQKKLNAFFISQPAKKSEDVSPEPKASPAKLSDIKSPNKHSEVSAYDKTFPPFFVQSNVTVAPITRFARDGYATQRLEADIDAHLTGTRTLDGAKNVDVAKAFNIPDACFRRRGKRCMPVKQIMTQILGGVSRPIDLTTDSQNMQIKNTRALLKDVPYKILKFAEDVRPPYTGTYTKEPVSGAAKLARNPIKRDLPGVDYDYDSEAEWEEPGEDEEDLASEGEDEEDADGEEDLDGFLDDADDEIAKARKLVMHGDLEPKSTGLCWEDECGRYPNAEMHGFAMEIIHENLKAQTPIDPFATHYWASATLTPTAMHPPRVPLNPMKGTSSHVNGPSAKTVKMFGLVAADSKPASALQSSGASSKGPKKYVPVDDMSAFKAAVQGSELSKLGLIEVLNKQFSKTPKSSIRNTLEAFARREGAKEADKRWVWREDGVK